MLSRKLNENYFAHAEKFSETLVLIGDFCALNNGGKFQKPFKQIYHTELELKLKHSGSDSIFLDLDITIIYNKYINKYNNKISAKLYDKRDNFFYCTHAKFS